MAEAWSIEVDDSALKAGRRIDIEKEPGSPHSPRGRAGVKKRLSEPRPNRLNQFNYSDSAEILKHEVKTGDVLNLVSAQGKGYP